MSLRLEVANYILALRDAGEATHQAEDRSLYEKYLASAGIILALIERGAPTTDIRRAIDHQERLWGQTWLQDPVFKKPLAAWEQVKRLNFEESNGS